MALLDQWGEFTPLIRRRMYTRYVVDNARLGGPWMRLYDRDDAEKLVEATRDRSENEGDRGWLDGGKRVGSSRLS